MLVWFVDLVFYLLGLTLIGLDFFTSVIGPFLAGFVGTLMAGKMKISLPAMLLVLPLIRFVFHPFARSTTNRILDPAGPGTLVSSTDLYGYTWFLPLFVGWLVGSYAGWIFAPKKPTIK